MTFLRRLFTNPHPAPLTLRGGCRVHTIGDIK